MLKNKNKFFNIASFFSIGIVVLFSLGKTINYYFYTDDYALLYHLQNNLNYSWPYEYITAFFTLFYKFFELRAEAYFALGIFTFFIASLGVYFFIKVLTKNKLIAYLSSIVFATGYIGLDQFTMMSVSSINNLNIINVSLTLILFILWLDTRKLKFYLAAIFMFWISATVFPFRAFPLVLFLPTIELILSFKLENLRSNFKRLTLTAIRFLPFLFIAYINGIFSYGVKENASLVVNQFSVGSAILNLITPDFLKELFAILGRFIFFNPQGYNFQTGLLFFLTSLLIGVYFCFGKYSRLGKSLLIVLFMTIQGYIGNMILLPSFDSNGPVNRYLTIAFIGYSSIFPILTFLLIKKLAFLTKINRLTILVPLLIMPLVIITSLSSRKYEKQIIKERSLPARQFYEQLKDYVPSVSGKSIFYFDHADYYPIASNFGSIILGAFMPKEVTLAVPYKIPIETIKVADNFNSLLSVFLDREKNTDHIYTFYYDENGLRQTTDSLVSLLTEGDREEIPVSQINYGADFVSPVIEAPLKDVSSLTPMIISLSFRVSPLDQSFFNFPFYGFKTQDKEKKEQIEEFYGRLNKNLIFSYLLSRKRYYDNVKVEVSSSHIAGQNPGEFLTDDKNESIWLSDESAWQIGIKPWIKIDLGEERKISRLTWIKLSNRVLSDYQISVSSDGISWREIKNRHTFDESEERVTEEFSPILTRFIMIKINKTLNNFTPGLSEIEVIEDKYKDVAISTALRIKESPFEYIQDEKELQQVYNYLQQAALLRLSTKTNKDESISNSYSIIIPITLDDQYHEYKVLLSPRGINLEKIMFELNFPARIEIGEMEISHQRLEELSL